MSIDGKAEQTKRDNREEELLIKLFIPRADDLPPLLKIAMHDGKDNVRMVDAKNIRALKEGLDIRLGHD